MSRAERRYKSKIKQLRRFKKWKGIWDINELGRLNKCHFGCGCPMCKPWKHKLDKKYKPSERRKIEIEENNG